MFGDFSRDSYDACKNYTRVLMQQGRPLTDADWNEQVSLIWDRLESMGRMLIGWYGSGPFSQGFQIIQDQAGTGFELVSGEYLVDGVRCKTGPTNPPLELPSNPPPGPLLVYLDVWERSVNPIEDPEVLEPALRGTDTAVRTEVMWALRYSNAAINFDPTQDRQRFLTFLGLSTPQGMLEARLSPDSKGADPNSPCATQDRRSTLLEDRLYRVEIHKSGAPVKTTDGTKEVETAATFKWSRDNGAVVVPVGSNKTARQILDIDRTQFSSQLPLQLSSWVELVNLEGQSVNTDRNLAKVKIVTSQQVTLEQSVSFSQDRGDCLVASFDPADSKGYYLRQWDHDGKKLASNETVDKRIKNGRVTSQSAISASSGASAIIGETNNTVWQELESGIEVRFSGDFFREGEYWWIRTTSDGRVIVLPHRNGNCPLAPRGTHHYAPIGTLTGGEPSSEYWRDHIPYPDSVPVDCKPCIPLAVPEAHAAAPATPVGPGCCGVAARPVSMLLSGEGEQALKGFFGSAWEITRRVPARYLKVEPDSKAYRRFRSPLLVSDILESSFDKYLAKVERCLEVDESEWSIIEADARNDYALAAEFQNLVATGQRRRAPVA